MVKEAPLCEEAPAEVPSVPPRQGPAFRELEGLQLPHAASALVGAVSLYMCI